MTPPPNMSRRNTANFHPWSLCGISFLAAGNLATSAVETPTRDALTRIVLRRLDAFSQAIFVGLLFEADLDFTCRWSISLGDSPRRDGLHVRAHPCLLRGRDPGELLAARPTSEQRANRHRTKRRGIGDVREWTVRARDDHNISTWRDSLNSADATIYADIQISRGPFRDWIPSCRAGVRLGILPALHRTSRTKIRRAATRRIYQYPSGRSDFFSSQLFRTLRFFFYLRRCLPAFSHYRAIRRFVVTSYSHMSFTMLYRTILCYHGNTAPSPRKSADITRPKSLYFYVPRHGKTRNDRWGSNEKPGEGDRESPAK